MPRSKHRRTPGGKSVRRPGHSANRALMAGSAARDRAYVKFLAGFQRPFHEQWPDQDVAAELLDLVTEAILDLDMLRFRVAAKPAVLARLVETYKAEDGSLVTRTGEEAEAALSFLAEQRMVVVDGDMISIHPRFARLLTDPPAPGGAGESPARSA